MKYLKTAVLVILLMFLFFLMSCQDGMSEITTPSEILTGKSVTGKTWSIASIEVELGSINPFECVADNPITYFPGGRYEVNEGYVKCAPEDPPSYLGFWKLISNESRLTVQLGDSLRIWDIVELKENVQRISAQFPDGQRTYVLRPI